MTRLIGDIHGYWNDYVDVASKAEKSIQIGDFGIGFAGPYFHDRANEFHADGNHRFIRGNHDNPLKCKEEMVGYIKDGTVENGVMFIGGAWSIDWPYRTEGVSWWRDEECSYQEFVQFTDTYLEIKPRIMITHDAPLSVTNEHIVQAGLAFGGTGAKSIKTATGHALDLMFRDHKPDLWVFGHWHRDLDFVHEGTRFVCLNELSYMDVDLDNHKGNESIVSYSEFVTKTSHDSD